MGEVDPGIEAVRVMSGDNPFGGLPPSLKLTAGHAEVFARLRGVEVTPSPRLWCTSLREILAELGERPPSGDFTPSLKASSFAEATAGQDGAQDGVICAALPEGSPDVSA